MPSPPQFWLCDRQSGKLPVEITRVLLFNLQNTTQVRVPPPYHANHLLSLSYSFFLGEALALVDRFHPAH
jgi:hypothetical protein